MVLIIFARKIALVDVARRCWQAIADSYTPASGRNVVLINRDGQGRNQAKMLGGSANDGTRLASRGANSRSKQSRGRP